MHPNESESDRVMKEMIVAAVMSAVLISGTAHYSPAKAGPSMATGVVNLNKGVDREACIKRSAFMFKELSLTENVQVENSSIYAESGEYTAHIRCLPDNGIAYVVVSGPDVKIAMKALEILVDKF